MRGHVEVDERDLRRLVVALRNEADGKELRRELVAGLKAAVEPAAQKARASILSMGVSGLSRSTPSLRSTVAGAVKVQVRTGRRAGISVRVGKRGMPRDFFNAPKRLNSRKGWRHQVFGTDTWVTQRGKPGWFDDSLARAKPAAAKAAKEAMDGMAQRIDQRTRG